MAKYQWYADIIVALRALAQQGDNEPGVMAVVTFTDAGAFGQSVPPVVWWVRLLKYQNEVELQNNVNSEGLIGALSYHMANMPWEGLRPSNWADMVPNENTALINEGWPGTGIHRD